MFAEPWVLSFLVAPFLLAVWVWARKGRRLALPFDHGRPGRGLAAGFFIHAGETLPPLALAVVILMLAGPQELAAPKAKRKLTNIEFCLDISGSMTAEFGEGSRYDAAMKAINRFLDYREGDAFGLTFFGNSVLHWVPLTSDVSAFRCAPPFMRPENAPGWFGGTEIGKALLACREVLVSREEGDRMILLVSDGYSWDLSGGRDEEIARLMRKEGIVVYAVHIADENVPDEIVNITNLTGGEVFAPDDTEALEGVFKKIDEMQVTRLEKGTADYIDFFVPFCIAGLSLLGLYGLAQLGLRYTPW